MKNLWENRYKNHVKFYRSSGSIGESEEWNENYYKEKMNLLDKIINDEKMNVTKILDAGCGRGIISEHLKGHSNDIWACDFSSHAIDFCKNNIPDVNFFVMELYNDVLDSTEQFDSIFCIDVLYHITDDAMWEKSISNMLAHLANGGTLIIADRIKGKVDSQPKSHMRFRSNDRYLKLIDSLGFEIKNIYDYWSCDYVVIVKK